MQLRSISLTVFIFIILSVSLNAQVFTLGGRYATGDHPECVVSADFDGDFDIDLAVGHLEDTVIYIYTNDGDANFTPRDTIYSFTMMELFTADLNGDGINDLMAHGQYGYPTTFYYNNGDGTFYVGFSREFGSWSRGMTAADFDGDNIVDVAVNHNFEGSGIFILFGLGDGVFEESVTMIVPDVSNGFNIVSADFDNDNDIDIVYDGGGMFSMLNNGDGTFADPESTIGHMLSYVVTDFNHDEYPDLSGLGMHSCTYIPQYMLGTPDSRFTQEDTTFLAPGWLSTNIPLPADFNMDGTTDIVICSREESYLICGYNDGLLNFDTENLPYGYAGGTSMAAGDFNGDGDIDFAVTNLDDSLTIVLSLASAHSNRILIPDDLPSIQDGIDYAWNLDTIIVQPGTYTELLNFDGKILILASQYLLTGDESYISSTILDGGAAGSVLTFENGEDSRALVTGFTIQNGNAAGYGGGIFCYDIASPTIYKNNIKNNYSGSSGGAIMVGGGSPVIKNNIITGNNCLMWGGGLFLYNSSALVSNNTIFGNFAGDDGGGMCSYLGTSVILNNIFWADSTTSEGHEIGYFGGPAPEIRYSDIQGGWTGEGNIDTDPLFRDPSNVDFHLMAIACGDNYDSPCVDAGDPNISDFLLDCDWGLGDLRSDMGAYGGGEDVITGIEDLPNDLPQRLSISQNYPNPFNASTTIQYSLTEPSDVTIEIYDILGRMVETLFKGEQPAGYHQAIWDAKDHSSGMYFYRIQAGDYAETRKMVLLK